MVQQIQARARDYSGLSQLKLSTLVYRVCFEYARKRWYFRQISLWSEQHLWNHGRDGERAKFIARTNATLGQPVDVTDLDPGTLLIEEGRFKAREGDQLVIRQ